MRKEFEVHMLNATGKAKAQDIAQGFDQLLARLETTCPPGREMSIVRTKLEEAAFFAKKAMAVLAENQDRLATYELTAPPATLGTAAHVCTCGATTMHTAACPASTVYPSARGSGG